ncbi:dynactin [Sodiomyces alkalinus F11]|uniref:Dynactin n=1 Tax=Sodiomyces alkalinus (strain CBS 110278 / VKM F-3762 / F11) TaxID=1314773 RepID=A0A3N2Q6Z4_SODAK|nr:dynactin [Sodiomyces alkalinus F11]ROT42486.1 dynactin [Sodiomyces alkalinus F11]
MSELALGQTIQLSDGRIGVVRFVGAAHFAPGEWVGIELEEDSGKNDGSVQGERYFDCVMGHGMFVRPTTLTIMAQPPPPPAAAAAKPLVRKPSRPSRPSSFAPATGRVTSTGDASLSKRMSLNASSPSPAPRVTRPTSIGRSPTKSPTKQLGSANSSNVPSRTGTPLNTRGAITGATKIRPSVGGARTSMGPPPVHTSRVSRQPSISSTTARPGSGAAARPSSTRLSLAGRAVSKAEPVRRPSVDLQAGRRPGTGTDGEGGGGPGGGATSPSKGAAGRPSPPITSPVQARTRALESRTATTTTAAAARTATVAATATAANNTAVARENEDLKAKLRVMERKRLEDREKLKQLEKVQEERDKYETIIQKLQAKFQPQQAENAELRKQLKEAEAMLESVEQLQAEHETTLELATLDREMAEETAEVLKAELDALKQKTEELELEVEILREENQEFSNGMTPQERSSAGWLQMEKTNERLREALLRLRDLTQAHEAELRDQIKMLETDLQEYGAVKAQFETAKEKLAQSETTVEDLRQQLDNALGAEDMIEDLTERNMSMAEQIEELRAVVEDLENLKEINDELEINHVQNEKELQEEIDFKDSVIAEQARRAAQQEEAIEDLEYTLSRFRELVTSLQSDLEDMRASNAVTEAESEQLDTKSRAMMDLNMKLQISAAKTQVKTIDLELRRLDAQEAEQHLEIVKLFLPETYEEDRNSVLALLRFKRVAFKAGLLQGFLKERVNAQPHPHPGHEDDVFSGCDAIDKLTWVAAMCDRFVSAISHCPLEQFHRFQGALFELEPVERALNGWIDGLRRDELKEEKCASELQRSIALMSHLAEVHIPTDDNPRGFVDDVHMRAVVLQSHLESAAATITTARAMVQRVVPLAWENNDSGGGEGGEGEAESDELAQLFAKKTEFMVSQTRGAKVIAGKAVRALEDLKTRSLSLVPDPGTQEAFEQCEEAARALAALARDIGVDLHALLHEEGRTEPYTYAEVQDTMTKTSMAATSSSEPDIFTAFASKLRVVAQKITDLAALSSDLTQVQEFDVEPAPWKLRAAELKALKTIPVDAEEELRRVKEEHNEARRTIAQRDESLSTAMLKIETLESRMRDAHAKAARMEALEAQIEAAQQGAAALRDDMEKQDRELKALEAERDDWKKLVGDGKAFAGGAASSSSSAGGDAAHQSGQARERAVATATATAREMDALRADVASLQTAVRYLREDNRRARTTEQRDYDWLAEPLRRAPSAAERRRALVAAEGRDVLGELVRFATGARVYDLGGLPVDKLAWRPARSTAQYHAAKQMEDLAAWKGWRDSVADKSEVVLGRKKGGGAAGGLGGDARKRAETLRRNAAAARLQVRLPGSDGKMMPGSGRHVQIVGSQEWEGLQGRLAAV